MGYEHKRPLALATGRGAGVPAPSSDWLVRDWPVAKRRELTRSLPSPGRRRSELPARRQVRRRPPISEIAPSLERKFLVRTILTVYSVHSLSRGHIRDTLSAHLGF
jgi:hypothetical protein